jgi:hypothetical protein
VGSGACGFDQNAGAFGFNDLITKLRDAFTCPDPGLELVFIEWFLDKVICSFVEASDHVLLFLVNGYEDYVGLVIATPRPDLTADFEPIHLGHVPIEDRDRGAFRIKSVCSVETVVSDDRLVAGAADHLLQQKACYRLVFRDQYLHLISSFIASSESVNRSISLCNFGTIRRAAFELSALPHVSSLLNRDAAGPVAKFETAPLSVWDAFESRPPSACRTDSEMSWTSAGLVSTKVCKTSV